MKKMLLLLICFCGSHSGFSQAVAINSTGALPQSSAILDVSSNTKGLLIPRMSMSQINDIAAMQQLKKENDVLREDFTAELYQLKEELCQLRRATNSVN